MILVVQEKVKRILILDPRKLEKVALDQVQHAELLEGRVRQIKQGRLARQVKEKALETNRVELQADQEEEEALKAVLQEVQAVLQEAQAVLQVALQAARAALQVGLRAE